MPGKLQGARSRGFGEMLAMRWAPGASRGLCRQEISLEPKIELGLDALQREAGMFRAAFWRALDAQRERQPLSHSPSPPRPIEAVKGLLQGSCK